MDRRIQRSKQALQEALLLLIQQKPYEAIQIQEITEAANTARITFYRHYGTKDDLLIDCLEDIYQQLKLVLPPLRGHLCSRFEPTAAEFEIV